jgi:hypothetical protein
VIGVEYFYLLLRSFLLELDVFVIPFFMFVREELSFCSHVHDNEGLVSTKVVISGKRLHSS